MLANPEEGVSTDLYKVLAVALELGIIDEETRWDEGLQLDEAAEMLFTAYTLENNIKDFDATTGVVIYETPEDFSAEYEGQEEIDESEQQEQEKEDQQQQETTQEQPKEEPPKQETTQEQPKEESPNQETPKEEPKDEGSTDNSDSSGGWDGTFKVPDEWEGGMDESEHIDGGLSIVGKTIRKY